MAALLWPFGSTSRQRDGSHVAVAWVARWVFSLAWWRSGWRQDGSRHLGLSFSLTSQFLSVVPTLYSIGLYIKATRWVSCGGGVGSEMGLRSRMVAEWAAARWVSSSRTLVLSRLSVSLCSAYSLLYRSSTSRQRDGSHVAAAWVARWVFGLAWWRSGRRQDGSRHLGLSFSLASQFLSVMPTLYSIGLFHLFLSVSPLNFSFPFLFFHSFFYLDYWVYIFLDLHFFFKIYMT